MRFYRPLLTMLLVAATPLLVAQPASAEPDPSPYPPSPAAGAVSSGTVSEDGRVRFYGEGMMAGETVKIDVTYRGSNAAGQTTARTEGFSTVALPLPAAFVTNTTADSQGEFSVQVRLTEIGTAVLTATGAQSGRTVVATVRVRPSGSGGGDGLAVTGMDRGKLALQVGAGILAIAIGTGLVWFTRRRRSLAKVDA